MEKAIEALVKDSKIFADSVIRMCLSSLCDEWFQRLKIRNCYFPIFQTRKLSIEMLDSGSKFGDGYAGLFHPLVGEYDLLGRHPEADKTVRNVDGYSTAMTELKETLNPELDLIASRIIAPAKEFQGIMKTVRKNITKREHKVSDNNASLSGV